MKLVIDEKLKHRLVGVSVILSLGAIFLPAMMKKSSQRLDGHFSVNVQLPPKPVAPNVAVTDEEQMFKTIKIARVQQLSAAASTAQATTNEAKDDFIAAAPVQDDLVIPVAKVERAPDSIEKPLELALLNNAAQNAVKHGIKVAANKPVIQAVKPAKAPAVVAKVNVARPASKPVVAKAVAKPAIKREIYAVQLASFSQLANAQALVTKLQQKGYKASYTRIAGRNGAIYKVYAGHSPIKNNVVKLKTQLASAMQLNGFVVNTGVS